MVKEKLSNRKESCKCEDAATTIMEPSVMVRSSLFLSPR